jgi:two-component sensor histidine kinase
VKFDVVGDAGALPGEVATSLAVVLNELMQNAVDHAFPEAEPELPETRSVVVRLARTDENVVIEVTDDGVGLPDDFSLDRSKGLGLSIVQALVTGELGGTIEMHGEDGTRVEVCVPLAAAAATRVVEPPS